MVKNKDIGNDEMVLKLSYDTIDFVHGVQKIGTGLKKQDVAVSKSTQTIKQHRKETDKLEKSVEGVREVISHMSVAAGLASISFSSLSSTLAAVSTILTVIMAFKTAAAAGSAGGIFGTIFGIIGSIFGAADGLIIEKAAEGQIYPSKAGGHIAVNLAEEGYDEVYIPKKKSAKGLYDYIGREWFGEDVSEGESREADPVAIAAATAEMVGEIVGGKKQTNIINVLIDRGDLYGLTAVELTDAGSNYRAAHTG